MRGTIKILTCEKRVSICSLSLIHSFMFLLSSSFFTSRFFFCLLPLMMIMMMILSFLPIISHTQHLEYCQLCEWVSCCCWWENWKKKILEQYFLSLWFKWIKEPLSHSLIYVIKVGKKIFILGITFPHSSLKLLLLIAKWMAFLSLSLSLHKRKHKIQKKRVLNLSLHRLCAVFTSVPI